MAKRISFEAIKDPVQLVKLLNAMQTQINNLTTLANELRTDHATFKIAVDSLLSAFEGDRLLTRPTLAIGSSTTAVSNIAFHYIVNGAVYYKAAVAAGTAPGNDVIPQSTYGAVALDIDAAGTITVAEAAANSTGYASAALAIAGIAAVASDKVRMGTVTATKSDGAFTFGTTALNAANTTVAYTDGAGAYATVTGSGPATLTASAVTAQALKSL
jgi:hypothetical protein